LANRRFVAEIAKRALDPRRQLLVALAHLDGQRKRTGPDVPREGVVEILQQVRHGGNIEESSRLSMTGGCSTSKQASSELLHFAEIGRVSKIPRILVVDD